MAEATLVEAINMALARAMEEDPNVLILGEDVGINGGVFRATVGLQQRFGPERVIDTPLAETLISGTVRRPGGARIEARRGNSVHGVPLSVHRSIGQSRLAPAPPVSASVPWPKRWTAVLRVVRPPTSSWLKLAPR